MIHFTLNLPRGGNIFQLHIILTVCLWRLEENSNDYFQVIWKKLQERDGKINKYELRQAKTTLRWFIVKPTNNSQVRPSGHRLDAESNDSPFLQLRRKHHPHFRQFWRNPKTFRHLRKDTAVNRLPQSKIKPDIPLAPPNNRWCTDPTLNFFD